MSSEQGLGYLASEVMSFWAGVKRRRRQRTRRVRIPMIYRIKSIFSGITRSRSRRSRAKSRGSLVMTHTICHCEPRRGEAISST